MSSSSKEIQKLGNTKQVSPAKKWCFTFNNYDENNEIKNIIDLLDPEDLYGIGKEVGEQGTRHLQGWIEFKNKCRPTSIIKYTNKIHWEKMKGNIEESIKYCSKDGEYITNFFFPKLNPIINISKNDFNGFQEMVYDIFQKMLEGIHWFYSAHGGEGKSQIAHFLRCCHEKEVLLLGQGKYADIINGVFNRTKDTNSPMKYVKTILIDLPRENTGYISLGAMESILDMHIYNSKFEGGSAVFGKVNIIIFSNSYPKNAKKLSARKWHIYPIHGCSRWEPTIEDIQETIWEE